MEKVMELGSKLESLGQRWNSHLSRIGQGLDELANQLAKIIPAGVLDRHQHGGLVWDRQGPSSNLGPYGPCFRWRISSDYGQVEYMVSPQGGKPGGGWYLHGDFSTWVEVGRPSHFRDAAKAIPAFLHSLSLHLQRGGDEAEQAAGVLSATLEALQAVQQ